MVTSGRSAQPRQRVLDQARRHRVAKPADQRRHEILTAAARLFRTYGFDATPVQAIADEANVAAGTIYLHFASKDAIVAALHEEFERGLLDRVAAVAAQLLAEEDSSGELVTYVDVIGRLVDGVVEYIRGQRDLSQALTRPAGRFGVADGAGLGGGVTSAIAGVIQDGVQRGYIATSDPEMTAYMLNVATVISISQAVALDDEAMLERVTRQTKELYVKALSPSIKAEP